MLFVSAVVPDSSTMGYAVTEVAGGHVSFTMLHCAAKQCLFISPRGYLVANGHVGLADIV